MEKFPCEWALSFRVVMTPAAAAPPLDTVVKSGRASAPDHFRGYRRTASAGPESAPIGDVTSRTEPAEAGSGNRLPGRPAKSSRYPFRVWFPPQSPMRIEYASELPRLLLPRRELGNAEDWAGVLYGTRTAGAVLVNSLTPRAGLEPVGIFAARLRGEVFLTETDILQLEALDKELDSAASIALVIAGAHGGFFVREPNGSMQTIQSYQEFPIWAPSFEPTRAAKFMRHARRLTSAGNLKSCLPLAIAAAAVFLSGCVLLPRPYFSAASPFAIQERAGQLRIALSSSAHARGARLQIVDGEVRRQIPISPSLSSVVYVPFSHDVHISLIR